jgi:ATP-dependent helicase HrpA
VQAVVHRQGVNRLAILTLAAAYKYLQKNLLKDNELQLKLPANLLRAEVLEDLLLASSNHCFFAKQLPYTKKEFEQCLESNRSALTAQAQQIETILAAVVKSAFAVRKRLSQLDEKVYRAPLADVKQQLEALLYPGFLYLTPIEYLAELPRYFSAIEVRLERIAGNIAKENNLSAELAVLTARLLQLTDNDEAVYGLEKLQRYRWLLEEYRVSVFAQSLKTRVPVSQKRLDKLWDEVLLEQKLSNSA